MSENSGAMATKHKYETRLSHLLSDTTLENAPYHQTNPFRKWLDVATSIDDGEHQIASPLDAALLGVFDGFMPEEMDDSIFEYPASQCKKIFEELHMRAVDSSEKKDAIKCWLSNLSVSTEPVYDVLWAEPIPEDNDFEAIANWKMQAEATFLPAPPIYPYFQDFVEAGPPVSSQYHRYSDCSAISKLLPRQFDDISLPEYARMVDILPDPVLQYRKFSFAPSDGEIGKIYPHLSSLPTSCCKRKLTQADTCIINHDASMDEDCLRKRTRRDSCDFFAVEGGVITNSRTSNEATWYGFPAFQGFDQSGIRPPGYHAAKARELLREFEESPILDIADVMANK